MVFESLQSELYTIDHRASPLYLERKLIFCIVYSYSGVTASEQTLAILRGIKQYYINIQCQKLFQKS